MEDCIFCRIAEGKIPPQKVYEDEHVLAFHDLNPQAPVHVLIIPKRHAANLLEARAFDDAMLSRLLRAAANVAEMMGVDKTGFRIVSNCGADACQSVFHLHIHLLGGEKMSPDMSGLGKL